MKCTQPVVSSVALLAVCLGSLSLVACKDGGSDATDGMTETATVGGTVDSAPTGTDTGDSTPTSGDPSGDPRGDPTGDPTGDPMDGPHALGTIILGESHPAGSGKTVPTVGASFIPDVDGVGGGAACTESVAGCQIALVPDCQDSCDADQYCGFDAGCKPTCQAICDEQCGAGEVCYFPAPNTSEKPSESSFGLVCMKSVPVNSFSNFSKPAPLAPLAWTVAAPPGAKGDELTSLSNT